MDHADMKDNPQALTRQIDMAQYLSYHDTPMVEVVVGVIPSQRTFHIHAGVLIENSEFFKSALQPYFTSGEQKKVHLPEESVEHFSSFARFVYDQSDLNFGDYLHYAKVYLLADRLIAPTLKRHILLAFRNDIEHDQVSLSLSSEPYHDEHGQEILRPLAMDEIIELATIVYGGTSNSDDGLRNLLSLYVACRMHERKDCHHCHTRQARFMQKWDPASTRELVKCGLDEFLFDVMAAIPGVCAIDDDTWLV